MSYRVALAPFLLTAGCLIAEPDSAGSHFRCDVDPSCPAGFSCVAGFCEAGGGGVGPDGGVAAPAPASCAALHAADPAQPDGVYTLDPGDGGAPFAATCDMTQDGGGWTLVMKIDGRSTALQYESPRWTSGETLAPDAIGTDRSEALLDGFARLPVSEIAVAFTGDGGATYGGVGLPVSAPSLRALFASPAMTPIAGAGRDAWLASLPGATLQPHCNLEGVNLDYGYNRLRLGIVANGEDDCASPDSRIGIGGGSTCPTCGCQGLVAPAAGGNDNGCTLTPAFAWVWVR